MLNQIVNDIKKYFNEDNLFENVMVKKAYDIPNKVKYPLISVQEILNSENTQFSTREGEQVTNLTYQIDVLCGVTKLKNNTTLSAVDSSTLLANKVSKLLGGKNYKMVRVGQNVTQPYSADNTIIRNIQRYECCLDLRTNTIYRR